MRIARNIQESNDGIKKEIDGIDGKIKDVKIKLDNGLKKLNGILAGCNCRAVLEEDRVLVSDIKSNLVVSIFEVKNEEVVPSNDNVNQFRTASQHKKYSAMIPDVYMAIEAIFSLDEVEIVEGVEELDLEDDLNDLGAL